MDDDRDGPAEMRSESDQLRSDWESATATGPGRRRGGGPVGATKWWRWYAHAGRWMPTEPPPPGADPAYWCMSESPPAFRCPRRVEADEPGVPTGPAPTRQTRVSPSSSPGRDT